MRFEPRTVRRCNQWIAEANCHSRNEFIEKTVNYYVDRLMSEDADSLPRSISVALDGRLSQMEESVKNVNRTNGKIRLEDHMRDEGDEAWLD